MYRNEKGEAFTDVSALVESLVARCAEILAEEEAHGADEPDPPADY